MASHGFRSARLAHRESKYPRSAISFGRVIDFQEAFNAALYRSQIDRERRFIVSRRAVTTATYSRDRADSTARGYNFSSTSRRHYTCSTRRNGGNDAPFLVFARSIVNMSVRAAPARYPPASTRVTMTAVGRATAILTRSYLASSISLFSPNSSVPYRRGVSPIEFTRVD